MAAPNLTALTTNPAYFFRPGGRTQFLTAHDLRHRTYRIALLRQGIALSGYDLTGPMNADWFARNLSAHAALSALFPGQIGGVTPALEMPPRGNDDSLRDWQQRHAQMHARLDALLGIH